MDLDDLDELAGAFRPTQRTTRFAPRSSKLAPKPKVTPKPKPVPSAKPEPEADKVDTSVLQKKEDDDVEEKPPVIVEPKPENGPVKMETDVKLETGTGEEERVGLEQEEEDDDEEDMVVSEIDVFFKPSVDPNTKIYVLQYPLRPCWRPYEMDDQCEGVRLKPASSQMELDLLIEKDSKNFDAGRVKDLKIEKVGKQTLHTKWQNDQGNGYTVGVLMGNKLHLNPVHAVVQLRPSFDHVVSGSGSDLGGTKRKNTSKPDVEAAVKMEEAVQQSKVKQSVNEQEAEGEEKWVALKFQGSRSDASAEYLKKMTAGNKSPLQFTMNPSDYVDSLCPSSATNGKDKGLSRRLLLEMPLEERVKKLLCEGPPLQRFNVLKHHAPDTSDEELLDVVQMHAGLVQGLWVAKSTLVMPGDPKAHARNYVLLMFSKSPFISFERVNGAGRHKEAAKGFLKVAAVERTTFKDWKLKENPDASFIKRYPEVVDKQKRLWEEREEMILKVVRPSAKVLPPRGGNQK